MPANIFDLARAQGLLRPENKGLSAKQLREQDPKLAERIADFTVEHRAELVAAVAGKLAK